HSRGWTGITIDDCWKGWAILLRQKQKKLIMLPSETMIWQPEFTDKTLSRKPGAVQVKEMRLQNISDIETANAWLPTFIEAYNNRFATSPRTTDNAHLDVHHSEEELGYIFSLQAKRVLSKNLTFQYKSSAFQVRSEGRGYRLRHSVVTVCENFDGEINVLYDGKALGWEKYVDGPEPIPLDDEKSVHERVDNARIDLRSKYYVKPKADHPWLTRRTQSHQQVKPPKLPKKKPDPDKKD
ncbi:hypothetical protein WGQ_01675, partial [Escherichia coli KTE232]